MTSLLEVELRVGTPARDQYEALSRDISIDLEVLLLAELIVERAHTMIAHLERAEPDDAAWEAA